VGSIYLGGGFAHWISTSSCPC